MTNDEIAGEINVQLDFIEFLTNKGLLKYLMDTTTSTRLSQGQYNNFLPIPIGEKNEMVLEFYSSAFGIFTEIRENPAMLNSLRENHSLKVGDLYQIKVHPGNGCSRAGVNNENKMIEAEIYTTPNIQGFETIAHEIGHLLTSRNSKHLQLLKAIDNATSEQEREFAQREFDGFCREKSSCDYDFIGEIDAMAIEKLFLWFLSKDSKCRSVLQQYDFDIDGYILEYEKEHENMMFDRLQSVVNVKNILDKYNITKHFDSVAGVDEFFKQLSDNAMLDEFKHDIECLVSNNPKFEFRYIAGEAVSKYWFDRFNSSDSESRRELLNKFVQFWHGTHVLDLDNATNMLCDGNSFEDVVMGYFDRSLISQQDLSNEI